MLLRRSGGHPLGVIIPGTIRQPTSKFIRNSQALEVSAHASRIQKFIFEDYGGYDTNRIVGVFSRPAPNLTHLGLRTSGPGGITPFPNLFGLDFPKLKTLELEWVEAWPKIVGANLTRITINGTLDPHSLSHCISHSPNLKVLKLVGIWDFSDPDPSIWQRIALSPGVRLTISSPICPRILALFSLPQDCHLKIVHFWHISRGMALLSYFLPDDVAPFRNLRTLTRLYITARFGTDIGLTLKCCRLDRPALEVKVELPLEIPTMLWWGSMSTMQFLGNLHPIVLGEVEELRMEGFVGPLEPRPTELLMFMKRMPVLTKLITMDGNEEVFRSALDNLGRRAVVVRAEG
jgi:hypothetical protein